MFKKGNCVIKYFFEDTSDKISYAIIYEENENGYIEIQGKNIRQLVF